MKIFNFFIFLFFVNNLYSQAHLGSTVEEIKAYHPKVTFETDFTNTGQKYITGDMYYGTFVYYFDSSGHTNFCMQVPHSMVSLNAQVEEYNKKYVIVSEKKWKAYLDGGGIMSIELEYNDKYELYTFKYSEL